MDLSSLTSSLLAANGLVYVFCVSVCAAALFRRGRSRAGWWWMAGLSLPALAFASYLFVDLHNLPGGIVVPASLIALWPEWAAGGGLAAAVMAGCCFCWFGFKAFQGKRAWPHFWVVPAVCALSAGLHFGASQAAFLPQWFATGPVVQGFVLFMMALSCALSVLTMEAGRKGDPAGLALLPSERVASRILRVASLLPALAIPFCIWSPLTAPALAQEVLLQPIWFVALTSAAVLVILGLSYSLPLIGKERAERQLAALQQEDQLTGLPNRARFLADMRKTLKEDNDGGTLLIMDIDRFKRINDDHGHAAGDAVLRSFAEFLTSFSLDTTLCGRLGSAEFALYLRGLRGAQLDMLASQICRAASILQTVHKGSTLRFTVSVGVADTDGAGLDFERLYEQADQALSQAKTAGRNQYSRFVLPQAPSKMPLAGPRPFKLKSRAS